jgi:hypothetical protein
MCVDDRRSLHTTSRCVGGARAIVDDNSLLDGGIDGTTIETRRDLAQRAFH